MFYRFLNRQKDITDGKDAHVVSNQIDQKMREDLERLKKIRSHRGLRHFWGLKVKGREFYRSLCRSLGNELETGVEVDDVVEQARRREVEGGELLSFDRRFGFRLEHSR